MLDCARGAHGATEATAVGSTEIDNRMSSSMIGWVGFRMANRLVGLVGTSRRRRAA